MPKEVLGRKTKPKPVSSSDGDEDDGSSTSGSDSSGSSSSSSSSASSSPGSESPSSSRSSCSTSATGSSVSNYSDQKTSKSVRKKQKKTRGRLPKGAPASASSIIRSKASTVSVAKSKRSSVKVVTGKNVETLVTAAPGFEKQKSSSAVKSSDPSKLCTSAKEGIKDVGCTLGVVDIPPKRKRGRPRKNPLPPPVGVLANTPAPPKPAPIPAVVSSKNKPKKSKKKKKKAMSSSESTTSNKFETERNASKTKLKIVSPSNIGLKASPQKRPKRQSRVGHPEDSESSGESEHEETKPPSPPSRKVTRSSSVRKSKFVVGNDSDSESDAGVLGLVTGKAPRKKGVIGIKGGMGIPSHHRSLEQKSAEPKKCPVRGCDSKGHLSGKFERHFLSTACPTYHHRRKEECVAMMLDRVESDKKLLQGICPSRSTPSQTAEQKAYAQKVAEQRKKLSRKRDTSPAEVGHRQSDLSGITSGYDLKLFERAQALASEVLEKELEGLDCTGEGIRYVRFGRYEMETWYQSPYPEEIACLPLIYICEFCLRYLKSATELRRHSEKCDWQYPPGNEIYRKGKIDVWEIDGAIQKTYCQNLCLLAKLFLDHKTLYYDVEPFLFYVMCTIDTDRCHIVGYFSKEKKSFLNYNVSCILTLPSCQRQGYGRLLIDFSYLLTRAEGKTGTPEKPLSDLGIISYRNYWKSVLLKYMINFQDLDDGAKTFSIKDFCQETGIASADAVSTLQALGIIKYWRGKYLILKIPEALRKLQEKMEKKSYEQKELDPSCLRWRPFVPPQTDQLGQKGT